MSLNDIFSAFNDINSFMKRFCGRIDNAAVERVDGVAGTVSGDRRLNSSDDGIDGTIAEAHSTIAVLVDVENAAHHEFHVLRVLVVKSSRRTRGGRQRIVT